MLFLKKLLTSKRTFTIICMCTVVQGGEALPTQ